MAVLFSIDTGRLGKVGSKKPASHTHTLTYGSQKGGTCFVRESLYCCSQVQWVQTLSRGLKAKPSLFCGIGPLMTTTTTLEFISAQSPHSMKGLLVGVYFVIQGFIQLLGITAILPLSITQPWTSPVVSCGFVYFFFILLTRLIGLLLFIVTAKKYKYRERRPNFFGHLVCASTGE